MSPPFPIVADVTTNSALDRLLLVSRRATEQLELLVRVRERAPSVRRTAFGLSVPGHEAPALLLDDDALDLRWSEDARLFAENRDRAYRSYPAVREDVTAILTGGVAAARAALGTEHDLDALDDHQLVNVAAMTTSNGFGLCVFDEQGAGKTVTFIHAFDVLAANNQADIALIIAPKSMIGEWPEDFRRFKGDLYRLQVVAGTREEKRRQLARPAEIFVTNFETAVSLEDELRSLLRRHGRRAVLVIDESFIIKNLYAKRTMALRRLREYCGRTFVLCGTPAPNAPQDLVQQFTIVDFGITFDRVQLPRGRTAALPVARAAVDNSGLFVRHLKRDVLPDLPCKRFHRLTVPLAPQQDALYRGALNDLIIDLRNTDDAGFQRQLASFLARRSALLQICSNPAGVTQGYTETPAKISILDTLLDTLIRVQHEKVVLWSFYTASLDLLASRYEQYGLVRYDGTLTDVGFRRDAIRRFQDDDETMVFLGNPAAAGAGITLHRSRVAIYESLSNQAAHYLQSLDRIHRRGQERDVDYLVLLCENTIELTEYDRLQRKERDAQRLLRDQVPPPITRCAFLAELEATTKLLQVLS